MSAIQKCNFYWIWATVSKIWAFMSNLPKPLTKYGHVTWLWLEISTSLVGQLLFVWNSLSEIHTTLIRNSFIRNLYWESQIVKILLVLKPQRLKKFLLSFSYYNPGEGALPHWVTLGMCGQNGWVFEAQNLRTWVNFCPKTCGSTWEWVIFVKLNKTCCNLANFGSCFIVP